MGQAQDFGYGKLGTKTGQQQDFLSSIMQMIQPNMQQAAAGFGQFLPGGKGNDAIIKQAQQRFQQNTVPSIMNAFGTGSKGSSSLNQALAASAGNMNTDLASMMAQNQLTAAQGMGQLGLGQGQLGSQDQFAWAQREQPFWQQALSQLIGAGGVAAGGWLGRK